jgi:hypothetical protein
MTCRCHFYNISLSSFWTAASLADILRRFKNMGKPILELPDCKRALALI